MRRARPALTTVAVLAAVVLLPAPAHAGDVQREEFRDADVAPFEVIGWGAGGPHATFRHGTVTIGAETIVMLPEAGPPSDWVGTANRLTGFDVDFRMRLGADATGTCLDESGTPPALLWVGDTTDLLQVAFAADEVCVVHPEVERVPLRTQRWHTYHLEVRGQRVRLDVDGRTVLDKVHTQVGAGTVSLGLETYRGSATWDWVRYDTAPGRRCTIRGTSGDDVLVGTPRADVICAGAGDDHVSGLGGDDVLIGGDGDDVLLGGPGHDLLQGGWGDDVLDNGPDSGRAEGGQGDDVLTTGADPDGAHQLLGGPGHDVVDYGARTAGVRVTLDGLGGDGAPGEGDSVGVPPPWGASTDVEEVRGGLGDDALLGGTWSAVLVGGPGADVLRGGTWRDRLDGVDGVGGNDLLDGGDAYDECTADPGDTVLSCNEDEPHPTMPPLPTGAATPSSTSSRTRSTTPAAASLVLLR